MFFLFLGLFWASFLLILGVLGRHFGSQKIDANFDGKTWDGADSGNPSKSRHGGSKSPKNYQQDLPWTARPPEALHIVAEARWRIYIYIYIYIYTSIYNSLRDEPSLCQQSTVMSLFVPHSFVVATDRRTTGTSKPMEQSLHCSVTCLRCDIQIKLHMYSKDNFS